MTKLRKLVAASAVASLALFGAACGSDEDGDGANTDEEINQVDEGVEEGVDDAEEDVKKGADEVEDEIDEGADEVDDGE